MANQPPYPVIVRNNQHYCARPCTCLWAACGEFAGSSSSPECGVWADLFSTEKEALQIDRHSDIGSIYDHPHLIYMVPGPIKGNDTSAVVRGVRWRVLAGEGAI